MKLSFSTRGWRDLPWADQVADALEYGFSGIEVYNLQANPTLTDRGGAFHLYRQQETARNLRDQSLSIPCFDTSIDLSSPAMDPAEVVSLLGIAEAMRVPYVAVHAHSEEEALVRAHLDVLLPEAVSRGVGLLIKTTGIYADTARLRALMDAYALDELGALWDMHHPVRDY